jgi:hypothetical protein
MQADKGGETHEKAANLSRAEKAEGRKLGGKQKGIPNNSTINFKMLMRWPHCPRIPTNVTCVVNVYTSTVLSFARALLYLLISLFRLSSSHILM